MDQEEILDNYDGVVKVLPEVVCIEPASICNLKCIHCPTGVLRLLRECYVGFSTIAKIREKLFQELFAKDFFGQCKSVNISNSKLNLFYTFGHTILNNLLVPSFGCI